MWGIAITALIGFVIVIYLSLSWTPKFRSRNGRVIPGSIASLEGIELGGIRQYVLIRGKNKENPILLFLHGGPGMPIMYYAHRFQRQLEDHCVVVQWDQRGAGKSFSNNIPIESMNVNQILSDALELIYILRERYKKEKVYLVGHSWGSYLGMLLVHQYPELFHAYIGVGQVTNEKRSRQIAHQFIEIHAKETGQDEAIRELREKEELVLEKWLFKFRAELYGANSWKPFLWAGLLSPEYNLFDFAKIPKGSSFSSKHMKKNAIQGELMDEVTRADIPVYFMSGKHDYVTPHELVELYFQVIKAPKKEIILFTNSAHFPFFEEPKKFADEIVKVLKETALVSSKS